jgi:zinc/manganese transport system substrate-binding protein
VDLRLAIPTVRLTCLVHASAGTGQDDVMPRQLLGAGLLAATVSLVLTLGACGSGVSSGTSGAGSTGSSSDAVAGGAKISVVTSTNVYGHLAQVVGGDAVQVTSIISDPAQDPHSYEANTQVALQLSKAKLVIENGGGYDDFVDTMIASSRNKPTVLNAVTVSGLQAPAGGDLNEHVWYSFPSMQKIADRISTELGKTDPARARTFAANAKTFNGGLDKLIADEAQLKRTYGGQGVGLTEPVPLYLLDAIGLDNKTPQEFSEAIEEGDDVSAAVLKETLDLYVNKEVKALVYNEQTTGPVTEQLKAAAEQAGVAVVPVTETLPQGKTYLSWMQGNLDSISRALGHQ